MPWMFSLNLTDIFYRSTVSSWLAIWIHLFSIFMTMSHWQAPSPASGFPLSLCHICLPNSFPQLLFLSRSNSHPYGLMDPSLKCVSYSKAPNTLIYPACNLKLFLPKVKINFHTSALCLKKSQDALHSLKITFLRLTFRLTLDHLHKVASHIHTQK